MSICNSVGQDGSSIVTQGGGSTVFNAASVKEHLEVHVINLYPLRIPYHLLMFYITILK